MDSIPSVDISRPAWMDEFCPYTRLPFRINWLCKTEMPSYKINHLTNKLRDPPACVAIGRWSGGRCILPQ
jgi:hypothetical protein